VTSRNDTVLPVARQVDTDASAVAVRSRPRPERGRHRLRPDLAAAAPAGPRRRTWRFALLLVVGWLFQAGLRAWLSRTQAVPLDNPDETAYLVAARFLAGGPAADFSSATLYRGGYPLLITPVFWFTSSPAAVYHAALLINAAVSAAVMPLGYLACRRLGLGRPAAYGVAMIAALLPAAFFYSEYAIADAIFPVLTLAWLLTTHNWLVATSPRARYAAATGSAVLSGYAWAVHSRGSVMLAGFAAICVFIAWRRPAARGSVVAGCAAAVVTVGVASVLDRYLVASLYPEGTRSLAGQLVTTLESFYGIIHITEMAAGQLWRLVLDSWGIAGIGLVAAVGAIARRGVRTDLRVMAALSVGVTIGIAFAAPAALPPQQTMVWASGRYLDGFIVMFFLVGAAVLLRAATRTILVCAACVAGLAVLAALTVAVYAGASLPTGRGMRFDFGEPAVLTQNWSRADVLVATAAALALLAAWVVFALLARNVQVLTCLLGAAVALVSLAATVQLTVYGPKADTAYAGKTGLAQMAAADGLKPGEQIAIATNVSGIIRIAQGFEVSSTKLDVFNPYCAPPPADVTVIDAAWPAGKPARASLPEAPAGWRIVAANRRGDWVVWRKSPGAAAMRVNTDLCKHPSAVPALTG
jgi:hypothetical protein